MRRIRTTAAFAALLLPVAIVATAPVGAAPFDDEELRRVARWFGEGRDLPPDAVPAMEARFTASDGTDIEARAKLWGWYGQVRFQRDPDPDRLARYRDHTLWIVEHAPGSALAALPVGWPTIPSSIALDDERHAGRYPVLPTLRATMAAWEEALRRHPDDLRVRHNAARFYTRRDPSKTRELLEGGLVADPEDPDWALELGSLHQREARDGDSEEFSHLRAYGYYSIARNRAKQPSRQGWMEFSLAESALASGDASTAAVHARAALDRLDGLEDVSMHTRLRHDAHIVLGRVALDGGDVAEAASRLRQAGASAGTASLGRWGPDFGLAEALLEAGERDAVLDYLEDCQRFWERGREQVGRWSEAIRAGETPSMERWVR